MTTALTDIKSQIKKALEAQRGAAVSNNSDISTKNKVFTLPNGIVDPGPMHAIVLDFRNTREYYRGVYNPKKPERPRCFAIATRIEDLVPSENAPEQMAEACGEENCPFDKFGSSPTGGKGKACKNGVRLAIVPANAGPDAKPLLLKVSPTGLKSWGGFINGLNGDNLMPIQTEVEISIDQDTTYPTLIFKRGREHDRIEELWPLREAAQAMLDKEPVDED